MTAPPPVKDAARRRRRIGDGAGSATRTLATPVTPAFWAPPTTIADWSRRVNDFAAVDRYIEEHLAAWTDELAALCAISSEASDPAGLRAAAEWTRDRLVRLGASVSVV